MQTVIFIHGMFQNAKSWGKWQEMFAAKGFNCVVPSWPMHDGEPAALRANPPRGLGELELQTVLSAIERVVADNPDAIVVGHSVGGLIAQILANRRTVAAAVAIDSVAPNKMLDLDWGFLKNSAIITNPLKGDAPIMMDAKTFHDSFANTLSNAEAAQAFEQFATHDSRNILRDCMGKLGHIDLDQPHAPLLLIAGEHDQIIPASLTEKNFKAYEHDNSVTAFHEFKGRSHYICGEPGWEEVAGFVLEWIAGLGLSATADANAGLRKAS